MKKITVLVLFSLLPCFIRTMQHSQEMSSPLLDVIHFAMGSNGAKKAFLYSDRILLVADGKTGELLINSVIAENPKDVVRLQFDKDATKVIVITSKGSEEFSYTQ